MSLAAKPADMRARMNPTVLYALAAIGERVRYAGEGADKLKRVTAYGKTELPELDREERHFPTSRQENIKNIRVELDPKALNLLHAALGMVTEADEFMQAVLAHVFDNAPLDDVNLREEIGDSQWYLALACQALGTNLAMERTRNMEKLAKRYPGLVFDAERAVNRDLPEERKVLERNPDGTEYNAAAGSGTPEQEA